MPSLLYNYKVLPWSLLEGYIVILNLILGKTLEKKITITF